MAVKSITVTELKCACLDADWRNQWIDGENPSTLPISPSGVMAVYGGRFHKIVKEFLDWLIAEENKKITLGLDDKYAIWNRMYSRLALREINKILSDCKLDSAYYFSKALKAFCNNLFELRNMTGNFVSWGQIYLTNEYHVKNIQFNVGGDSLFISGQLDTVRVHPKRGLEIVDYKLTQGGNLKQDLLQLAIYTKLLTKIRSERKYNGAIEYYTPELHQVVVTFHELSSLFEDIVLPVIYELLNKEKSKTHRKEKVCKYEKKIVDLSASIKTDRQKDEPSTIYWRNINKEIEIVKNRPLLFPIGVGVDNQIILGYLADPKMCHVLVAGASGSGKSEFLRSMFGSLIRNNTTKTLKLSIIDPKFITFNSLSDCPYLTGPIINDTSRAVACLEAAVDEMEERYKQLKSEGFEDLNSRINAGKSDIPFYVIIFSEFAGLVLKGKKEKDKFEQLVGKLGANGRVVGIHLVLATQRPEKNIVTDIIKSNLPLKICMKVTSPTNSKTILNHTGAERLFGRGDLLCDRGNGIERAQSPYIPQDELLSLAKIHEVGLMVSFRLQLTLN